MAEECQTKPPPIDPVTGRINLPRPGVPDLGYGKVRILADADAVKNHLGWGQAAIGHVRRFHTIGASNKVGDLAGSFGLWLFCVAQARSEEDEYATLGVWDHTLRIAEIAARRGCGNCMEQTAVALKFLADNGMFPIDGMEVDAGDHRFVVIGRRAGDVYNLAS